jgi:hypothetical protein
MIRLATTRSVVSFRLAKDLVAQTIQNLVPAHKSASPSILTMMRRLGACPAPPRRARKREVWSLHGQRACAAPVIGRARLEDVQVAIRSNREGQQLG